jgi:hypothetical protein
MADGSTAWKKMPPSLGSRAAPEAWGSPHAGCSGAEHLALHQIKAQRESPKAFPTRGIHRAEKLARFVQLRDNKRLSKQTWPPTRWFVCKTGC